MTIFIRVCSNKIQNKMVKNKMVKKKVKNKMIKKEYREPNIYNMSRNSINTVYP